MKKVLIRGMITVFLLYMMSGIFGLATFTTAPDNLTSTSRGGIILMAEYHENIAITISIMLIGFSVLCAVVATVKPTKDSLLGLVSKKNCEEIEGKYHYIANFLICISALVISFFVSTLDQALEIMGTTLFPFVNFLVR